MRKSATEDTESTEGEGPGDWIEELKASEVGTNSAASGCTEAAFYSGGGWG